MIDILNPASHGKFGNPVKFEILAPSVVAVQGLRNISALNPLDQWKRRTLSNLRKVSTWACSSPVILSSWIFSPLVKSCSSHQSSSTKASTHCSKQMINTDPLTRICNAPPFSFLPDQASDILMTIAPLCQVWAEQEVQNSRSIEWFSTSLFTLLMNAPEFWWALWVNKVKYMIIWHAP